MSEPAKFPTRRLRDAGATSAEIDELHAAFARSDEVYKQQFANSFIGKSKVEVRVWLEDARTDKFVSEEATSTADASSAEPKRRGREPETNATVLTGNEGDEEN